MAIERFTEGMNIQEALDFANADGYLGSKGFKTSISIKDVDSKGRTLRIWNNLSNKTVLGGRTMLQEQYFGITPNPRQHLTLNQLLEIPHSVDVYGNADARLYKQREVRYFCIGIGAENQQVPGTSFPARNSETALYNTVPFRCVPESADLSSEEQQMYRLKKKINIKDRNYFAYYAKKMELEKLYMSWNGNEYEPAPEHTVAKGESDRTHPLAGSEVKVYTVFNLSVEKHEFKEWYKIVHGSLDLANLNELGMIAGYDAPIARPGTEFDGIMELATAELVSKMTHSRVPMDEESHSRKIKYSIFS